jgi:putative DNA primase/helicase
MTLTTVISRGWGILPSGLDKKIFKPCIKRWKEFQTRRPTKEELTGWMKASPDGWMVVTGAISGIVVLDFDGPNGRATMESLGVSPHRITPSGSYHADFKHPGWRVKTLNDKTLIELGQRWPGLDIRADGGYALILGRAYIKGTDPPQIGAYKWLHEGPPYSLDILPVDLREFLGLMHPREEVKPKKAQPTNSANGQDNHSGRVSSEILIERALERAPGGRNNAGFWFAQQLRDNRYSQTETESLMRNYASRCPATNTKGKAEPYDEQEIQATVREVYSQAPRKPWAQRTNTRRGREPRPSSPEPSVTDNRGQLSVTPGASADLPDPSDADDPDPSGPDLLCQPFTDTGNAERVVAVYGRDIHFCFETKKWLVWDGRRWNSQDTRRIKSMAKRVMRMLYLQAADENRAAKEPNPSKHARKSESAAAIKAMLTCAEYEDGVPLSALDFDRDPYLLNFQNGTLDLRTGALRAHRREDLITKLIHHNYRPEAKCPVFDAFLYRVLGGPKAAADGADEAAYKKAMERTSRLRNYLQRAFGYSLTARTIEKMVFLLWGKGDNGKSTLLALFLKLLEEYACLIQIDSLMVRREESNNAQADLADLRGARFVMTSETEQGQRLSEGKLKRITQGMGKIKATRKYENPIEFEESHKLWVDANHLPAVRGTDNAIWNRLSPIPFTVTIPKDQQDRDLVVKLLEEAEGILSWAVQGAQAWYKDGLQKPNDVETANKKWRSDSDQIGRFIEARCVKGDKCEVRARQLYLTYKSWAEESGEHHCRENEFSVRMEDLGFQKQRTEKVRFYKGIEVLSES